MFVLLLNQYETYYYEYKYIFDSCQSARNDLSKLAEKNLIKREGKNKSNIQVWINPEMDIHTGANLLINLQLLTLDSTEG
jgi:hypothetical protein